MRKTILLLMALVIIGCQKNSVESRVEGNWFGSVAEFWESDHDKYIILSMFEGEVLLDKTYAVTDEGWQGGFGTYTIEGNIIAFDIELGAIPKSHGIKQITHAEIVGSEHHDTLLKVYYSDENNGQIKEHWMWFDKTR